MTDGTQHEDGKKPDNFPYGLYDLPAQVKEELSKPREEPELNAEQAFYAAFDNLFCGCGSSLAGPRKIIVESLRAIREYTQDRDAYWSATAEERESMPDFWDVRDEKLAKLWGSKDAGLAMLWLLDAAGATEHDSSVSSGWLTGAGNLIIDTWDAANITDESMLGGGADQ